MIKSDTIVKIAPALLKAQQTMGNASKDAKNPFFKSKYADLNAVREVAHPALNAQGISVLQPMVSVDGRNYVETLLLHESGEYIGGLTEIICSKMSDPQSAGAATSYARRYGLQSLMSIGAEDSDAEGAMNRLGNKITTPQAVTAINAPYPASGTITVVNKDNVTLTAKSNGSFKKAQAVEINTPPLAPVATDDSGWD